MNANDYGIRETALAKNNISLVYVDVTMPAQKLERSHLCGPAAGLVQAEALACVSILGAESSQPKEAVTLRFRVSGPIAGILVENMQGGGLRGYTHNKVLNNLDSMESIDDIRALGELGELSVVRSIPGKNLSSAMINVHPASLCEGVKQYFTQSLQRTVDFVVEAHSTVEGVDYCRALLVECMPDGDKRTFNKFCRRISKGAVSEALKSPCDIEQICSVLDAGESKINEPQPLQFKCRCSAERVENMVNGLPDEDIKDMIHSEQPTQIICHMCGEGYRVGKELLWSILESRGHDMDLGEEFDYG